MNVISKEFGSRVLQPAAALCEIYEGGFCRLWSYTRLKKRLRTEVDPTVVVLGLPEIHGTANIQLGKHLYLYRDLYWETRASGRIEIGDRVVLSRGVHIVAFEEVSIGTGSMVGEYVSIRDANHNFGRGVELRESGHTSSPIRIGQQVWIGRGAIILPGVQIGDHSVVGANAVVTKDVPAGTVVAGVPARPISRRTSNAE